MTSNQPAPKTIAGTIAAHLDVGAVVTAVIGFLMAYLVNSAVGKLDKLTDGVASLNEKMAEVIVRWEYQEKKDSAQDDRIRQIEERLAGWRTRNAPR